MAIEKAETIPTIDHKPHAAFFRQSGWLMIAAIVGGAMSYGVHLLNKVMTQEEYSAFGVLLTLVGSVPTMPLQMVFAQQAAETLATGRERQLSYMVRLAWLWTSVLWLIGLVPMCLFHKQIVAGWHLPHESGLWIAMAALLLSLWSPLFSGLLQGRQDFFWLRWASIFHGALRLGGAAVLVMALALGSTGMIAGLLMGIILTAGIAMGRTRDLWSLPVEKFDTKKMLAQVIPLFLGFGACQFMFTADTMFATAFFDGDQMKPYVMAGT